MSPATEPAGDDPLDVAVEDFLARRRRGEPVDIEEHIGRHPTLADRLREVLPSILLLESAVGRNDVAAGAAAASAAAAPPPERLGEFRLLREIGRGGMGVVYEAEQAPMGRRVALKILPPAFARDPARLGRFQREASLAARLDHPAVCPVHAAGVTDGVAWIAMRFVEGIPLSFLIAAAGDEPLTIHESRTHASTPSPGPAVVLPGHASGKTPLPGGLHVPPRTRAETARVLEFFEEASRGLYAAHLSGVVHRDVKPGNLMVSTGGRPVILDFGLARDLEGGGEGFTETGDLCGTPAYMAPEQVRGETPGTSTDVWALGVSLHEAVCGRKPFEAPTRESLYRAILEAAPASPRAVNPVLPRDLEVVIATALAKEGVSRYRTALDFAEDLRRVRMLEPILAKMPALPARFLRWVRRRPGRAALVFSLVVAVGAAIALTTLFVANIPRIRESERRQRRAEAEDLVEEASFALSWGAFREAQDLLGRALAIEPELPEAVIGRVLARLLLDGADAALSEIDAGWARSEPSVLDRLRSLVLRRAGREAEAAAVESRLAPPASAVEWYLTGRLAMADCDVGSGCDFDRAFECFERAIVLSDHARALYHFERAHAAGHSRDAAKIDEASASLRVLWPDAPRARWWLADLHRAAGRSDEAIRACRELLEDEPGDPRTLRLLGFIHMKRHEFPAAAEAYGEALRRQPGSTSLELKLVEIDRRTGALDSARTRVGRLLASDPDHPGALAELALLHLTRREWADGEALLRRAIARRSREAWYHVLLSECLLAQGRLPEATDEARRAVQIDARDVRTQKAMAMVQNDAEDLDGAMASWEEALRLAPKDTEALRESGLLHARRGDLDQGIERLTKALESGGKDAMILGRLGAMHLARQSWAEGLPVLEASVRLGGKDVAVWNDLGVARERTGDQDGALAAWREAARLAPGHPRPPFNIGTGLLQLGRYEEALESLMRSAVLEDPGSDARTAADLQIGVAERRQAAARRLEEHLGGSGAVPSADEFLEMARVCTDRKQFLEGFRLLDEAFDRDPSLPDDHSRGLRVEAAKFALRASQSQLEGSVALRDRARVWLTEEVAAHLAGIESGRLRSALVRRALESWLKDPVWSPVRDPGSESPLPAPEREAWAHLWSRIRALLDTVRE